MLYYGLKQVHVFSVHLSFALFLYSVARYHHPLGALLPLLG